MSFAFNQFDGDTTTSGSDKEQGYETHAQPSRAEIHRALTLLWPERDRIELRIIHKKPNASGKKPIDILVHVVPPSEDRIMPTPIVAK